MTEKERILSSAKNEYDSLVRAFALRAREEAAEALRSQPELSKAKTRLDYVQRCLDSLEIGRKISPEVVKDDGGRNADIFKMRNAELQAEREKLEAKIASLTAENGEIDAKKYYCPICRDTGYVTGESGERERCGCFSKILSRYILASSCMPEGKYSLEPPAEGVYSDEADKAKYGSEESPAKIAAAAYREALKFVSARGSGAKKKMFITGRVGVGKTHLACCIGAEAAGQCLFVRYGSISVILDSIQNRIFNSDEDREAYENRREYIEKCDLLIIDDLGVENITDRRFENLITLIDGRTDSGRKTVVTSNLGLKEIKDIYGERLASRFVDRKNAVNIRLLGDDIRLRRL